MIIGIMSCVVNNHGYYIDSAGLYQRSSMPSITLHPNTDLCLMNRTTLAWAAFVLMIAVAFGAFGAHGLKAVLSDKELGQWQTGVQYQFYHGLGLLFLALAGTWLTAKELRSVRLLFLLGIMLFCGSLYLLSTRAILGTEALTPFLGPITPMGGLLFIAGWGSLLVSAIRGNKG